MWGQLAEGTRAAVSGLLNLYRDTSVAYGVASLMVLSAFTLIVVAIAMHAFRIVAIARRVHQVSQFVSFGGGQGADDKESEFFRRFSDIDVSLSSGRASRLAYAWRRYRKTLIISERAPIRSTQQPQGYFRASMPAPTWLGFWANIYVGFGLLATFLGLVAALTFSVNGMQGNDPQQMLAALQALLAAAASKFVTSVAGVFVSIILRIAERVIVVDLDRWIDRLSAALELGVRVDPNAHSAVMLDRLVDATRPAQQGG